MEKLKINPKLLNHLQHLAFMEQELDLGFVNETIALFQKSILEKMDDFSIKLNEEDIEWVKTLEDLLFIIKYNLYDTSKIMEVFSNRELYDNCFLSFKNRFVDEINNYSDSDLKKLRKEEKLVNLKTTLPDFHYVANLRISLFRKAIKWLESYDPVDLVSNQNLNSIEKIETVLTVEQLSLLFKLLLDLGYIKSEIPNLAKAVSSIFSTKKVKTISFKSIKNDIDTPKSGAVDFWDGKGQHIQTLIKEYKERISI